MGIVSDTWFSYVTREWYGKDFTQDQFQEMWREFLLSSEVRALPANATPEEYRRLYLQFIAHHILDTNPWFAQITQAAHGNTLTDAEVEQIIRYFLTLPEVLSLPATATEADYRRLFLRFIARLILEQDPWYQRATLQLYGETTAQELERLLLDFLGSPEVIALPVTATPEDYQRLYVKFLSSKLNRAYQAELATTASPEAIAKSKLMYSIFEILAEMLTTTSVTQIRETEVVTFLTKKREEYTKMLSHVPLYVGTGTVDLELAEELTKQRYEGVVTITSSISSETIGHWNSTLNVCEWYWYSGKIVTGANLTARLSDVLLGLANTINESGVSPQYYNSPVYRDGTDTGGGWNKQLVIYAKKTADGTFTAYRARRAPDKTNEEISNWDEIGTFTFSDEPVVVKVTKDPTLVSSADSANTQIVFSTDPSLFILGYGGITLQDIAESLFGTYMKSSAKTASFTLYSGDWKGKEGDTWYRNRMVINVTMSSDGKPQARVEFYQDKVPEKTGDTSNFVYGPDEKMLDWDKSLNVSKVLAWSKEVKAANEQQASVVDAISSAFLGVWQDAKAHGRIQLSSSNALNEYEKEFGNDHEEIRDAYYTYCMNARDPKIAWKPGILGSDIPESQTAKNEQRNVLYSLNAAERAKINQRLQSYLSAIGARIDVLSNLTDQQQQAINATITGIETTNNLIKEVIRQMMQILSAMFK